MNVIRVDAADDPRLAGYAGVSDERRLAARGEFIAEGRIVVTRLLEFQRHAVRSLLLNEAALAALTPVLAGLEVPIYVCAPRFFERLTGHHFHRGCLALAARPPLAAGLAGSAAARRLVVLDRVGDPDNVGSVFRSALAFGIDGIWLGPGCADPLSRKAIRTSMGATLRVPFARLTAERSAPDTLERAASWPGCLDALTARGFELLALSLREPALELERCPRAGAPFALFVGAEGEGLSEAVEERATRRLRIGMREGVDSLNVGVAAGIALFALVGAVASA